MSPGRMFALSGLLAFLSLTIISLHVLNIDSVDGHRLAVDSVGKGEADSRKPISEKPESGNAAEHSALMTISSEVLEEEKVDRLKLVEEISKSNEYQKLSKALHFENRYRLFFMALNLDSRLEQEMEERLQDLLDDRSMYSAMLNNGEISSSDYIKIVPQVPEIDMLMQEYLDDEQMKLWRQHYYSDGNVVASLQSPLDLIIETPGLSEGNRMKLSATIVRELNLAVINGDDKNRVVDIFSDAAMQLQESMSAEQYAIALNYFDSSATQHLDLQLVDFVQQTLKVKKAQYADYYFDGLKVLAPELSPLNFRFAVKVLAEVNYDIANLAGEMDRSVEEGRQAFIKRKQKEALVGKMHSDQLDMVFAYLDSVVAVNF